MNRRQTMSGTRELVKLRCRAWHMAQRTSRSSFRSGVALSGAISLKARSSSAADIGASVEFGIMGQAEGSLVSNYDCGPRVIVRESSRARICDQLAASRRRLVTGWLVQAPGKPGMRQFAVGLGQ